MLDTFPDLEDKPLLLVPCSLLLDFDDDLSVPMDESSLLLDFDDDLSIPKDESSLLLSLQPIDFSDDLLLTLESISQGER